MAGRPVGWDDGPYRRSAPTIHLATRSTLRVGQSVGRLVSLSVSRTAGQSAGWLDLGPYRQSPPTIRLTPTTMSHHINRALSATTSDEEYAESRLVGWSVGRLVGWSVYRSVCRLVDRPVGWDNGPYRRSAPTIHLVTRSTPRVGQLVGRLVGLSVSRTLGRPASWLGRWSLSSIAPDNLSDADHHVSPHQLCFVSHHQRRGVRRESVGRSIGWSVSLTVGRSAGRLGRWSLSSIGPDDLSGNEEYAESRSVGWLVGRLVGQSDGWSVGQLVRTMVPIVDRP